MCDKYRLPFIEHFQEEPLVQHYEVGNYYTVVMLAEINHQKQHAVCIGVPTKLKMRVNG